MEKLEADIKKRHTSMPTVASSEPKHPATCRHITGTFTPLLFLHLRFDLTLYTFGMILVTCLGISRTSSGSIAITWFVTRHLHATDSSVCRHADLPF